MKASAYEDLPRAKRRRLVVRAVLRPTLTAACLVVLYFVLPMDEQITSHVAVRLAAGLCGVAVLIAFQTRSIARDRFPRMRAIEAFAMSVPLFLLIFATGYFLMARDQSNAFTQPLTRVDSLYFTVTVFSSTGFGDIAARSESARIVTMVQMIGDLVFVGVAAQIILGAVRTGLSRRDRPAAAGNGTGRASAGGGPAQPGG